MRRFVFLLLLVLLVRLDGVCQVVDRPPNILFILTDDHARKAVSTYDSTLIRTPSIDRIAAAGARFDQAFVTNSICAPSRATILTGKYSHVNGQVDNHEVFDGGQTTFPKLLQAAGYQTALIGKWHLKSAPTGFDYWSIFPEQGFYYNPDVVTMGDTSRVEGYATDLVTDMSMDWLDDVWDESRPFFLFYSHKAPHRNWMPALRHLDTLESRVFPEPASFRDDYGGRLAADSQLMHLREHFLTAYDSKVNTVPLTPRDSALWKLVYEDRLTDAEKIAWEAAYADERREYVQGLEAGEPVQSLNYQRYLRDYLRCVLAVDENVGRMLDYLDRRGLTENTLVVYVSDQGLFLGEHGWFDKRWMYEESIRIPFLVSFPKSVRPAQVRQEMVINADFAPTILDFAGVPIPSDMQGKSLKPLLEGEPVSDWREDLYYRYYEFPYMTHVNPHYGIRDSRYKLIRFHKDVEGWEFYDLQNDPTEQHNAYEDARYRDIIAGMKNRLVMLREMYGDTDPER